MPAPIQKIVIVGPGAMGCLMATLLSEAGHTVWLLDHNAARADALRREGLRVTEGSHTRRVKVPITTDSLAIPGCDLLILCTKAFDTAAAMRRALPLVSRDTTVLTLQNGLGNVEIIARMVAPELVVAGTTAHGATIEDVGVVQHHGRGPTVLAAPPAARTGRPEKTAAMLTRARMDAYVHSDLQSVLWNKLILNAAINPLTAVHGVRNGQLLKRPSLRKQLQAAVLEAAAVARAKGVAITCGDPVVEAERLCQATANNLSSMLQDLQRGKRTEADAITGMIVKEAHLRGVPVPVNTELLRRVKAMERGGRQ